MREGALCGEQARLGHSQREQSEKRQQGNQKKQHTSQTQNQTTAAALVWKGQMPSSELRSNSGKEGEFPFMRALLDQNVFPEGTWVAQ